MPRTTYHHGDLPRALVEVSVALIRTHGVDGFSLRAAAREAGVHPAAVYRHFADREELMRAVAEAGFRALTARMAAGMGATTDPAARFAAAGAEYVGFALDNPEFFRVMSGRHGVGRPGGLAGVGPPGGSAHDLLLEALRGLDGPLALPLDAAAVVAWSLVHGLAALLVDGALPTGARDVAHAVADVTAAGLRAVGSPPVGGEPPVLRTRRPLSGASGAD